MTVRQLLESWRQAGIETQEFVLSVKKYPIVPPRVRKPGMLSHTERMEWTMRCRRAPPNDTDVQWVREGWAEGKGIDVPPEDTEYLALKCELFEDRAMTRNNMTIIIDQFGGEIAIVPGKMGAKLDAVVDDWPVFEKLQSKQHKIEVGYELGKVIEGKGRTHFVPRNP